MTNAHGFLCWRANWMAPRMIPIAFPVNPYSSLVIEIYIRRCWYFFFQGASTLPRVRKHPEVSPTWRRPSLRALELSSGSTATINSSRSPDRFLAPRRPALEPSSSSFQSNKDPNNLTTEERLLRDPRVSVDAFDSQINLVATVPKTKQPPVRRNNRRSRGEGGKSNCVCLINSLTSR